MRSIRCAAFVLATSCCLPACHPAATSETTAATQPVADKPFVAGGTIRFDLDGGSYEIKPASDSHIHVAVSGGSNAAVDVTTSGNQADVKIKNTPHSNFHAVVEVPTAGDLVVRLSGGELAIGPIAGNKDVESYAGNVRIDVGNANDYARVDAAVKAGDIDARPFGGSKSGLMQNFTWSGPGKYTLRAQLGAGNLVLGQ
jgi:hypothetical protein